MLSVHRNHPHPSPLPQGRGGNRRGRFANCTYGGGWARVAVDSRLRGNDVSGCGNDGGGGGNGGCGCVKGEGGKGWRGSCRRGSCIVAANEGPLDNCDMSHTPSRITPISIFPRQGGRGKRGSARPLDRLRVSGGRGWIPAFAGMTEGVGGDGRVMRRFLKEEEG